MKQPTLVTFDQFLLACSLWKHLFFNCFEIANRGAKPPSRLLSKVLSSGGHLEGTKNKTLGVWIPQFPDPQLIPWTKEEMGFRQPLPEGESSFQKKTWWLGSGGPFLLTNRFSSLMPVLHRNSEAGEEVR